ncbi:MAG TPA: 3-deoxy-D-manno-octulosonic acid kinase [Chiayiivirga sp.]|nr:3-deoxy-D-manno-octulosonic acid kinase [Chiayiivirga sp.]
MTNAVATVEVRRIASAQGVIVFDAALLPQATPELGERASWPHAKLLSGRGGRGGVSVVHGDFGAGLLRHYHRGGVIGRWIRDRYLYLGEASTRCLREFQLLLRLRELGLPVPRPIFATWRRSGLLYRADLMTMLIPEARTLAECLRESHGTIDWEKMGETLAQFHAAGVFHADLNAHNILIDAQARIWLIDFDRGRLRHGYGSWQASNLMRLRRSLDKLGGIAPAAWSSLQAAYGSAMAARGRQAGE